MESAFHLSTTLRISELGEEHTRSPFVHTFLDSKESFMRSTA
jgi:hypothetical protein